MAQYEFVLGFKALAELIPNVVGQPVEAEHHAAESGNGEQRTTTGLMVWRKADNITAFTDGDWSWIRGPRGLEKRFNSDRFDWERDPVPSPIFEYWESPNRWPGRPYGDPVAIVLHTMAGSEVGAESWLTNPASQASAHYGCNLSGPDIDVYVPLEDRAWHAGILEPGNRWFEIYVGPRNGRIENPNNWTVGVETEDAGSIHTPVTDSQYGHVIWAGHLAMASYPSIRYLLPHSAISPRSRPNCCGPRWMTSGRIEDLARDLGLELVV